MMPSMSTNINAIVLFILIYLQIKIGYHINDIKYKFFGNRRAAYFYSKFTNKKRPEGRFQLGMRNQECGIKVLTSNSIIGIYPPVTQHIDHQIHRGFHAAFLAHIFYMLSDSMVTNT
jgi:predicted PolB exonuclease-like 3'-5' exonuclease